MLQKNIVKVVLRYAVDSVSVYTIWRLFVDTGFLLVMLCIRPFAKTSENENKVESKGISKILRLVSNYFYKVSKK